jgi:hypothetical protein
MDDDKTFFIQPELKNELNTFKKMITENHTITVCVDGEVRSGKSTLAIQIGLYLDPSLADDLDRVCFTTDEFEKAVLKYSKEKGKVIILDEAINMFASGESITKVGKKLNKLLMMCGLFNQIYILCLPSIFDLNPYVRRQHTSVLIRMWMKPIFKEVGNEVITMERGHWYFYGKSAKNNMLTWAARKYDYAHGHYDFEGRNYGKVTMENTFSKYDDKKRLNINKLMIESDEDTEKMTIIKNLREAGISDKIISKGLGWKNVRSLYYYLEKKEEGTNE